MAGGSRSSRRLIAATVASALIAAQSPTSAQPQTPPGPTQPASPSNLTDEQRAVARAAAAAGVDLLQQGRYAEALDRFQRAESLVHAPTHLLYIARTQVKLGQLVEASETYLKIMHEVLPSDAPRAFVDAQAAAAQESKELDARIPTLLIRVEGKGATDATVTMDGTALPAAMIGLSAPVDPGTHALRAVAKDGTSAELHVKLAPGSHETAVLQLRAGESASPLAPAPAPADTAATSPPPGGETPPPAGGAWPGKTLGWIGVGVGAAGLVAATVFVAINRTKRTDANALCSTPDGKCPQSDSAKITSLDQQADNAATGAWIGYIAGGALLATGLVLLFTSGEAKKSDASRGLHPWIGAGAGGLAGEF
jgi:hypothetical protein